MNRSLAWRVALGVSTAIFGSSSGHAVTYMTAAEARATLVPDAQAFVDRSATLSADQRTAIRRASGTSARGPKVSVWEARGTGGRLLGWVYVDQVLGKHEYITYAVALDARGAVTGIEILDYRETYGDEIRNPRWRAQFRGKALGAELKLDRDIRNISGATLSCRHVTDGVKRLLATHALLFGRA